MIDIKKIQEKKYKKEGIIFTAHDLFTTGSCSQLALALQDIIQSSSLIAIYDALDENFETLETPWLIHAGIEINGLILDIEGIHDRETWISNWGDLATELIVETGKDGLNSFQFENEKIKNFAKEIAIEIYSISKDDILKENCQFRNFLSK